MLTINTLQEGYFIGCRGTATGKLKVRVEETF